MQLGVVGTSLKKNEKRVPIHPDHLPLIPPAIRQALVFESGYGQRFGRSDTDLKGLGVGIASRQTLLERLDAILLLKPMPEDFQTLRPGGVLWGWPHCMQQFANTQAAIERQLTVIAMEEMFIRDAEGQIRSHPFYKNNELGGYCGVLHALSLKGWDGFYGKKRKVVILSFGAVGKGALRALQGRGFSDITVCTQKRTDPKRPGDLNGAAFCRIEAKQGEWVAISETGAICSLLDLIAEADILINAVFQDPNHPVMYLKPTEVSMIKPGCYLLDISCDQGLGFPFSQPTSFDAPLLTLEHFDYYAVDHTPNYLWESASWEVSQALLPYLPEFLKGPVHWRQTQIFREAIQVEAGVIQNPKILDFQQRNDKYPHPVRNGGQAE